MLLLPAVANTWNHTGQGFAYWDDINSRIATTRTAFPFEMSHCSLSQRWQPEMQYATPLGCLGNQGWHWYPRTQPLGILATHHFSLSLYIPSLNRICRSNAPDVRHLYTVSWPCIYGRSRAASFHCYSICLRRVFVYCRNLSRFALESRKK